LGGFAAPLAPQKRHGGIRANSDSKTKKCRIKSINAVKASTENAKLLLHREIHEEKMRKGLYKLMSESLIICI
jgi:hypothetical protein